MLRTVRWLMFVVLLAIPGRALYGETVQGLPAPTGYVNDFAGVLTPQTVESLDELCGEVDHGAHAQIAVVTIKTIDGGDSIEEFATALEDKWKVGTKGTDRGVLMIFVMSPRRGRIEVGYGLEGILNDAKVGDIGRKMAPLARQNDYNDAIPLGVKAIASDIAADAGVSLDVTPNAPPPVEYYQEQPQQTGLSPGEMLLFGVIVVVVLVVLISTGHIGMVFFLLYSVLGGGGFGGGGGGGFGGFGGGGSGGGGASGDF